jgi:hypothetical protein
MELAPPKYSCNGISRQCTKHSLEHMREVLDKDFSNEETQRDEMQTYESLKHRGSYRLSMGLMKTEAEERRYIKDGFNLKLPRPKTARFTNWLKNLLR